MAYIESKVGPEGRKALENALEAGAATAEGRQGGGLRKALGQVLTAAATTVPFKLTGPIAPLLLSAGQDPDLVRAVAGRSVPLSALGPQAAQKAAIATGAPPGEDPFDVLRYGTGKVGEAARGALNTGMRTVPQVLKMLTPAP